MKNSEDSNVKLYVNWELKKCMLFMCDCFVCSFYWDDKDKFIRMFNECNFIDISSFESWILLDNFSVSIRDSLNNMCGN